jgi:hypothetical protein
VGKYTSCTPVQVGTGKSAYVRLTQNRLVNADF